MAFVASWSTFIINIYMRCDPAVIETVHRSLKFAKLVSFDHWSLQSINLESKEPIFCLKKQFLLFTQWDKLSRQSEFTRSLHGQIGKLDIIYMSWIYQGDNYSRVKKEAAQMLIQSQQQSENQVQLYSGAWGSL